MIVIRTILVIFEIGFIMFVIIRDKIMERETIVAGDEVDTVIGRPPVISIEISRSCQSPTEIPCLTSIAFAKSSYRIPSFSIPFRPVHREVPYLIGPDVPGFGNEL